MNFGQAIESLKAGQEIQRKGWNGKGMWVKMMEQNTVIISDEETNKVEEMFVLEPFFVIKNVAGTMNTWVPSISDLLAEDWEVVE